MGRPWLDGFDPDVVQAIEGFAYPDLLEFLNQRARSLRLRTGAGQALAFVDPAKAHPQTAYETFIAQTGHVPTRDNFHDRYNALLWMHAPRTKAMLNALQANAILGQGTTAVRGPLRDAATLWDENLAVVMTDTDTETVMQLLSQKCWHELFVDRRDQWATQWHVRCFGHALIEKLRLPYKGITAHCLVFSSPDDQTSWTSLDGALARWLSGRTQEAADSTVCQEGLSTRSFLALPVMGIPGWCSENADPAFYEDRSVFRVTGQKTS